MLWGCKYVIHSKRNNSCAYECVSVKTQSASVFQTKCGECSAVFLLVFDVVWFAHGFVEVKIYVLVFV